MGCAKGLHRVYLARARAQGALAARRIDCSSWLHCTNTSPKQTRLTVDREEKIGGVQIVFQTTFLTRIFGYVGLPSFAYQSEVGHASWTGGGYRARYANCFKQLIINPLLYAQTELSERSSARERGSDLGGVPMRRVSKLLFVSSCSVVVSAASAAAQTCESVAAIALPHATVTAAQSITSSSFTPPGSTIALTGLPPFCRVAVTSTPTSDSIIKLEVWIPLGAGWNGKYQQLGCGGFCGSIGYGGLATAVQRGYASAATDDGSQALGSGSFALGHPEKIVDFGYRALKETTDKAKAVIAAFTGQPPHHSYFAGCSDGGREALMEAQRYPEDFDGIIVGAPANAWTHLFAGF